MEELVARARAGSREAAEELFELHWPRAWRLASTLADSHAAAEDIAQEAFERAFRSLAAFDGRSSFATWLHRIIVNAALNARRREQRLRAAPPAEPASPDASLRDVVQKLPDDRRLVVTLRYWLDLTPTEIADLLEIPVGTVNSRLARALADLRTQMEEADVA